MEEKLTLTIIDGKFCLIDERGFRVNGIEGISVFQDELKIHEKLANVTVELIVNVEKHEKNEDLPF